MKTSDIAQGASLKHQTGASVQRSVTCTGATTCISYTSNEDLQITDQYVGWIMSRKYKIFNSRKPYFVSFAFLNWIDLFTRKKYIEVITNSLSYCISNKGLLLNAWCIMTNHVHLIIRSEQNNLSNIIRDMKKFTSYKLYNKVHDHPQESRKQWLLWMFEKAGQENYNNNNFQIWQQDNHPVELDTNEKIDQRLNYLHMNPVKAGFVKKPVHWLHSSARQYAGLEEKFELELIE